MRFPDCFKEVNISVYVCRSRQKKGVNFKFPFFDICQLSGCYIQPPESAGDKGVFPYLYCCTRPGL